MDTCQNSGRVNQIAEHRRRHASRMFSHNWLKPGIRRGCGLENAAYGLLVFAITKLWSIFLSTGSSTSFAVDLVPTLCH